MSDYKKLPYTKKLDMAAKTFIVKCTDEELYKNKKINGVYFRIRNFLNGIQGLNLDPILELLDSIPEDKKEYISLYNLTERAKVFQRNKEIKEFTKDVEQVKGFDTSIFD